MRRELNVIDLAVVSAYNLQPPTRTCGECHECCVDLKVEQLGKPAQCRCEHLDDDLGCTIYDRRPSGCRIFYCAWRLGWGDESLDRPDRNGVLMYVGPDDTGMKEGALHVIELKPEALQRRFYSAPGSLPEFVRMIQKHTHITSVMLFPHGHPRARNENFGGLYSPHYSPKYPVGQDFFLYNGVVNLHIGAVDTYTGNIWTREGVVARADTESYVKRMDREFNEMFKQFSNVEQ